MFQLIYACLIALLVVIGIELLATLGKLVSMVIFVGLGIAFLVYLVRNSRTASETPPPSKGHRLGE